MNPGSRYVKLLNGRQPNLNNGTVAGGLAHALTQGMRGYAAAKADREEREKAEQRQQAITEALEGMNRGGLSGEGPTQQAAGNAPFENPGRMAQILLDPASSGIGRMLVERAFQPPAERYETQLDDQGRPVAQVSSTSGRMVPIPSNPYEPKAPPAGWQMVDGGMEPIPGGPADPGYIDQTRAPQQLSPRDKAFASLTPELQRQVLMRPSASFNMGKGETEFEKATGKDLAAARTAIVDSGHGAVGTEQTFQQLGDLMQEGVKTGSLQPLVASLQGIAEDLGVDLQGEAQALGIELGDLGNQQNFDRLATQVVINGFEQFKGNLNQKEVSLALGAFGGLGTSPEANADAIAAGIAASQIARERAVLASRAKTQQQVRTIQESILSGDVTDFRQRKEQIKQGILARRASGGMPTIQGDADYEALPSGTRFRAPDGSVRVKP